MWRSHFLHMVVYALILATFFAHFWQKEGKSPWHTFWKLLGWMLVGGLAFAWLMKLIPG